MSHKTGKGLNFLRLHRPLLIHQTEGKGSGGWVDSLSQALTTDDFCLSNLPRGPPSSLPKPFILPKTRFITLVERCTDTDRRWEGLRLRARHKRKG